MLPEGVMAGNQINSAKLLTSTVKKALLAGHMSHGNASLCLSGSDIIIRHTVMPRMAPEQLKQNVIDEISGYLAVDPALYTIDYKVQDVLTEGAAVQYKVMIVAVPKNIIAPYIQALSAAGLRIVSIDVAANAKEKLVNYLTGRVGNFALLDLGMSASVIDTFQNGRFFVSKTSTTGLNTAAETLAKALETDPLRALEMMLSMDPDPACKQAVNDYVDQVLYDAVRVTDYFRSRNQMTPVEQVFVCGGGARIPGIVQMIQDRLNLPVRDICGLLSSVLNSREEIGPRLSAYASAAGATLLEVD
jgi:type IV pilus assembly protein PilM